MNDKSKYQLDNKVTSTPYKLHHYLLPTINLCLDTLLQRKSCSTYYLL